MNSLRFGDRVVRDDDADAGALLESDVPATGKGSTRASSRRLAACSASAGERETLGEVEELVAAEPTQRVGRARDPFEAAGHRDEQLVAGEVAEGVVHPLEVVEVEQEHRARSRPREPSLRGPGRAGR